MSESKDHHYRVNVTWTGNNGTGTSAYRAYERAPYYFGRRQERYCRLI